jgi:Major intrinsic protein
MGKLDLRIALAYVCAQLAGATLSALPLLGWGSMGRSVAFGATLPGGDYGMPTVLMGEASTTFALIAGLCVFLGFRALRPFTPAMFPFLYAVMVYVEAPISGTSTNPARSLGPAMISGAWQGWWVYGVGPLLGTLAAVLACGVLANRIEVAKLDHFDSDRGGLFRSMPRRVRSKNCICFFTKSYSIIVAPSATCHPSHKHRYSSAIGRKETEVERQWTGRSCWPIFPDQPTSGGGTGEQRDKSRRGGATDGR